MNVTEFTPKRIEDPSEGKYDATERYSCKYNARL